MRENRTYGSEGGGAGNSTGSPYPYRIPNAAKRNLGWRIDHICATRSLAAQCQRVWIDLAPRLKPKPSDHTFIIAEFER